MHVNDSILFYDTITKAFGKSKKVKMTRTNLNGNIAEATVIDKEGNEWELKMTVKSE